MEKRNPLSKVHIGIKVAFIYFVVGILWILFSDRLLTLMFQDSDVVNRIQTVKGFAYVFFTALVVYFSVLRFNAHQDLLIKELSISETKYRTLVDNLPVAFFQKDSEYKYQSVNKQYELYCGKGADDILGKDDFQIFDAEMAAKYHGEDELIINNNESVLYEAIEGEGEDSKIISVIKIPYSEDRDLWGILGIIVDITETRKRENEFLKLYTAIDNSDYGIVITDRNNVVEHVNEAYESITGYQKLDLMGKNLDYARSNDPVGALFKKRREYVEAGRTWRGELYNIRKNGSTYWERCTIIPVLDKSGVLTNHITFVEDITDRKVLEKELKALNDDLEIRVEQRTEELYRTNEYLEQTMAEVEESQAQLTEAYDQLEKSHMDLRRTQEQLIMSEKLAALGDLVASVAHEINTPLGIGVTLSTFIQERHKELVNQFNNNKLHRGEMRKYIDEVEEAAELMVLNLHRASELVTSFKQVATDQSTLELRKFKVKEYIEETLISLKPRIRKTSHEVEVQCDQDMELLSYPGAISQIITNLVMNSLIHGFRDMDNGRITISIMQGTGRVIIAYKDNGQGISDDEKANVFKPFYTTNRENGSTGLGMHIVYTIIVQILKGNITIEDNEDQGVKFMIEIPSTLSMEYHLE